MKNYVVFFKSEKAAPRKIMVKAHGIIPAIETAKIKFVSKYSDFLDWEIFAAEEAYNQD